MAGEGGAIFNTGLAAAGSMVVGSAKGHQGRKFARENREYATELANTAYQRATTDMRAAGLNPMLMYGSGGAAQTVQGAQPDMGAPMGPDSSSARKVSKELAFMGQQTKTAASQAALNRAQANSAMANEGLLTQQLRNSKLLEPELRNKADAQSGMAGRVAPYLNMFIPAVASAVGAAALGKIGGKAAKNRSGKPGTTGVANTTGGLEAAKRYPTRQIPPKGRR